MAFKIYKESGSGTIFLDNQGGHQPIDLVASQNVDLISIFSNSLGFYLFFQVDYSEFLDNNDSPFASANDCKAYLDGIFVANTFVTDINNIESDLANLTSSDITNFNEAVDDEVASLLVAGSGISIAYNDASNSLTIASSGGYTNEDAQDAVGTILTDTASVDLVYNDAANTISASVIPGGVDHDQLLNYTANDHVDHSTVNISAGAGLNGGGDITASRTISMPNVGTAGSYGSASSIPVLTTDTQGRVSSVVDTNIAIPSTQITDFVEAVQDAVGTSYVDSASVDISYNDAGNTVSAVVIPGGVDHDQLLNFVANEHIDHSSVNISAGTGLTGGGDITTSRSLAIANTGVTASTYGSINQVPQLTVNAQGQLTSVSNVVINVPQLVALNSNITTTLNTPQNATGLSFSVQANSKYKFKFFVGASNTSAAQAVRFTVTTPSGIVRLCAIGQLAQNTDGTGVFYSGHITASGDQVNALSVPAANVYHSNIIEGILVTGATAGVLQLQYWTENTGTASLCVGSMGELWRLI